MDRYAVSITYGHVVQIWEVEAESKKDAWERAESHGKLKYQTVYSDISPASNYVTCISDKSKNNTISKEQYDEWIKEAMELGMTRDGYYGLPFNDVV